MAYLTRGGSYKIPLFSTRNNIKKNSILVLKFLFNMISGGMLGQINSLLLKPKIMRTKITFLSLVLCSCFMMTANAQKSTSAKSGSGDVMTSTTSRGEDPEVKSEMKLNGDGSMTHSIQPGDKGARSRGDDCEVEINNWTDLYIKIYVDGDYELTVSPWGEGSTTVGGGTTKVYVKAPFTNGTYKYWGPIYAECSDETFEVNIYWDYYTYDID